jgi:hypothetical protein
MLGKHMNAMLGVSASRRMHEYEPFQVLEGVEEVNFFLVQQDAMWSGREENEEKIGARFLSGRRRGGE